MAEHIQAIEIKKRALKKELSKEKPNKQIIKRLKDSIKRHKDSAKRIKDGKNRKRRKKRR